MGGNNSKSGECHRAQNKAANIRMLFEIFASPQLINFHSPKNKGDNDGGAQWDIAFRWWVDSPERNDYFIKEPRAQFFGDRWLFLGDNLGFIYLKVFVKLPIKSLTSPNKSSHARLCALPFIGPKRAAALFLYQKLLFSICPLVRCRHKAQATFLINFPLFFRKSPLGHHLIRIPSYSKRKNMASKACCY